MRQRDLDRALFLAFAAGAALVAALAYLAFASQ